MEVREFPQGLSPSEAVALQCALAGRVRLEPFRGLPRVIAGADVSGTQGGDVLWGGIVVTELDTGRVLDQRVVHGPAAFPYVPGLLSFREIPVLLRAFAALAVRPDAILVDGQGLAHPRRFGLACHLGVLLDVPTIGCAKSRLVGEPRGPLGRTRGSRRSLYDRGCKVGVLLRTQDGVSPLWVSPGHRMDFDSAARIVLACAARFRIPEPIRLAHQCVGRARRQQDG